jgi:hypothetical protein
LCGDSRHYTFGAIDDEFPKRPAVQRCVSIDGRM